MTSPDPRIGTTLKNKWRIDALLGAGGMATVYAATHRNGKRVAVKILHPELSRDVSVRERFVREGYLANKVGRGAVTVDDDDVTDDGAVFLVMELLKGETLEARRERSPGGRLPVAEVAAAMGQVLATLGVAHAQGIVHRDLKPENMFITCEGTVKILDFGIARLREGGASKSATATGAAMGTPAYLPPEQARGNWNEVDARTDLWAVGATMFALLAGRCVHEAENVNLLLLAAMTKPAPQLRSIARDVPPAVAVVVDRALQIDRDSRWPDASAMREALRGACPEVADQLPPMSQPAESSVASTLTPESTTTYRTATSAKTVPPGMTSGRTWIGVAVAGVVVLAGAAWGITRALSTVPVSASATFAAQPPQAPPSSLAAPTVAPTSIPAPTAISVSIDELPDVRPTVTPVATMRPHVRPPAPTDAAPKPAPAAPALAPAAPAPDPFSVRR